MSGVAAKWAFKAGLKQKIPADTVHLILKLFLIMKGQKRNRGAQKMNLFTILVEL